MRKSNKSWKRRFSYRLGAVAFRLAQLLLVRKDPLRAEIVGQRLGRFGFRIAKKHRNRAISNLKMCFPEMSEAERINLARRCFEHFGMVATDFLRSGIRTNQEVLDSFKETEGVEIGEAAIALGKGVLAMSGHFGNWERTATYSALRGVPMTVVQRDANDALLNDLMTQSREKSGMEVLSRGNASRAILGGLKEKRVIAILADQNNGESYLPFLGQIAGTVLGPALIHLRTGAPMIPCYSIRIGPNQYKLVVEPALTPMDGYEDPKEALMASYNASLEKRIRQYPEQWLWLHDRWKSARRKGLIQEP